MSEYIEQSEPCVVMSASELENIGEMIKNGQFIQALQTIEKALENQQ